MSLFCSWVFLSVFVRSSRAHSSFLTCLIFSTCKKTGPAPFPLAPSFPSASVFPHWKCCEQEHYRNRSSHFLGGRPKYLPWSRRFQLWRYAPVSHHDHQNVHSQICRQRLFLKFAIFTAVNNMCTGYSRQSLQTGPI